ncbi:MAG: hypothetical protein V1859_07990 [archaeon]
MTISELHKTLEKRQDELVGLLSATNESMTLEKQHQIYGAINELKLVLETLNYYRTKEILEYENEPNIGVLNSSPEATYTNIAPVSKNDNQTASIEKSDFFSQVKEKIFSNFLKKK